MVSSSHWRCHSQNHLAVKRFTELKTFAIDAEIRSTERWCEGQRPARLCDGDHIASPAASVTYMHRRETAPRFDVRPRKSAACNRDPRNSAPTRQNAGNSRTAFAILRSNASMKSWRASGSSWPSRLTDSVTDPTRATATSPGPQPELGPAAAGYHDMPRSDNGRLSWPDAKPAETTTTRRFR